MSYKLEVKLQVAVHIPHYYINDNNDHFLNAKEPWVLYKEHDGMRGEWVNVQVQKSNQIMTEEH